MCLTNSTLKLVVGDDVAANKGVNPSLFFMFISTLSLNRINLTGIRKRVVQSYLNIFTLSAAIATNNALSPSLS
jgi:hypothetical protein